MEKENIIWTVPEVAKYLGCNVSSIGDNSFVMLYSSLYNSNAYDLKPISKDIYIGMVLYAKGNFITESPHRIYKNICSKSNFQTSIKALVEHGFIEIILSGKFSHSPNKYQFCDKWQKWNRNKNMLCIK